MQKNISASWEPILNLEFQKDYFKSIERFIENEKAKGKIVFPPEADIFNAFNFSSFEDTKLIILGQDPYHGIGQAQGLSFSVPFGFKIPPSLKNIYKELKSDLNIAPAHHGELIAWAKQGVLLLNAMLSVNAHEPASHQKASWENFTDYVIQYLSNHKKNLVFLLWGKFAQNKSHLINEKKHLVLKAAHPSPFSAHRGFFGCKHFSKSNKYLMTHGKKAINWSLHSSIQTQLFD